MTTKNHVSGWNEQYNIDQDKRLLYGYLVPAYAQLLRRCPDPSMLPEDGIVFASGKDSVDSAVFSVRRDEYVDDRFYRVSHVQQRLVPDETGRKQMEQVVYEYGISQSDERLTKRVVCERFIGNVAIQSIGLGGHTNDSEVCFSDMSPEEEELLRSAGEGYSRGHAKDRIEVVRLLNRLDLIQHQPKALSRL